MFVDRAVYSRNRAFRLYLSSKAGKEAMLQCTGALSFGLVCHVLCEPDHLCSCMCVCSAAESV